MPRVNVVDKSRKSPGACGKRGKKIEAGEGYRHWKFRFGGKRIRCLKTECAPRSSELTNSDKLSQCYSAGESIEDAVEAFRNDRDLDALRSAMEDAAQQLRDVAQEYEGSADNMESVFTGGSPTIDECRAKAESLNSKADEIDSCDLEEFDESETPDPEDLTDEQLKADHMDDNERTHFDEQDAVAQQEILDDLREAMEEAREGALNDWAEEQASKAEEHVNTEPEA